MGKRLNLGTVLLLGALVLALTGSATAATVALITGKQIKNGSIELVDLSPSAKKALKGRQGARGPQGAAGAQGPAGPVGPAGAAGPPGISTITEVVATKTLAPGAVDFVVAVCPPGQNPVSGGTTFIAADGEVFFDRRSANGWAAAGDNFDSLVDAELRAHAYCSAGVTNASASSPSRSDLGRIVDARRAAAARD